MDKRIITDIWLKDVTDYVRCGTDPASLSGPISRTSRKEVVPG